MFQIFLYDLKLCKRNVKTILWKWLIILKLFQMIKEDKKNDRTKIQKEVMKLG